MMARSVQTAFARLKDSLLANSGISRDFLSLAWVHMAFTIATGMSGIFINLFLFNANAEMKTVVLYNVIVYFLNPFAFFFAGYFGKKFPVSFALRLGIIFYNILYILLIIFQNQAAHFLPLIAVVHALGGGFYFLGYNVMLFDFTNSQNRQQSLSLVGTIGTIVSLFAPSLAGFLITVSSGMSGYILVFSISLIVSVIATVSSIRIPNIGKKDSYRFLELLMAARKRKNWTFAMLGEFLRGTREGMIAFLLSLLLYMAIKNENIIGLNSFLCSLLGMVGYYIAGKFMNNNNASLFMLLGASVMFVLTPVLFFYTGVGMILVYSVLNTFTNIFVVNSSTGIMYGAIHQIPESNSKRVEAMVLRDGILNFGRAIGASCLLFVPSDLFYTVLVLLIFSAVQFLSWLFYALADKHLHSL